MQHRVRNPVASEYAAHSLRILSVSEGSNIVYRVHNREIEMPKIKHSVLIKPKGLYRCQRRSLNKNKKIKIIHGVAEWAEHMP